MPNFANRAQTVRTLPGYLRLCRGEPRCPAIRTPMCRAAARSAACVIKHIVESGLNPLAHMHAVYLLSLHVSDSAIRRRSEFLAVPH